MKITSKTLSEQRRFIAWHSVTALFFFASGAFTHLAIGLPGVSFLTIALYHTPSHLRDLREYISHE